MSFLSWLNILAKPWTFHLSTSQHSSLLFTLLQDVFMAHQMFQAHLSTQRMFFNFAWLSLVKERCAFLLLFQRDFAQPPVQGNHTVFLVHHFIDFIIFIICLNINIYLMNYWLIIDYLPPTSMSLIQIRKDLQSFIYTCIIRRIWQSISDPQIIVVVISDPYYPLTTMCPFLFTHNPLHLQTCWHQRQLFLTSFFFKSFTKSPFQASQTTIALFSF